MPSISIKTRKLVATSAILFAVLTGPAAALTCTPMNATHPSSKYAGKWLLMVAGGIGCRLVINNIGTITSSSCNSGSQTGTVAGNIAVTSLCKVTGTFNWTGIGSPNHLIWFGTMIEGGAGRANLATGFLRRTSAPSGRGENFSMINY